MSAFLSTTVCSIHPGKPAAAPLENGAMRCCLKEQLNQLKPAGVVLRYSLFISKPLYILCTSPAFSSPLLETTLWWPLFPGHILVTSNLTSVALGSGVPPSLHRWPFWHLLMEYPTLRASSYPPSFQLPRTVTGPGLVYMERCLACEHTPSHCHKSAEVLGPADSPTCTYLTPFGCHS